MQMLADQIAIAIGDSRLYEAQQRQAWLSTALLEATENIGQQDSREGIVGTVLNLLHVLVGIRKSLVFTRNDDSAWVIAGVRGTSSRAVDVIFVQEDMPLLAMAKDAERIMRPSALVFEPYLPPSAQSEPWHSIIAVPLRAQGQCVGLVVAEEPESADRPAVDMLLQGIAQSASLALDSARLYTWQREQAWISTALLQVASAITDTASGLDETLTAVARLAPLLAGVRWCAIFTYDPDRKELFCVSAEGSPADVTGALNGAVFEVDEYPGWSSCIASGLPRRLLGRDELDLFPEAVRCQSGLFPLTAYPMRAQDRFLGCLLTGDSAVRGTAYDRQSSMLAGIANQVTIAIETERLQRQAIRQETLEHEIELARRIQQSFLPACCPQYPGWQLGIEWRAARGVGGDFYDLIDLGPQRLGLIIADVADKGVAAALYMALSRTVTRMAAADGRGPSETLRRVNSILMGESHSGMFVSMFYGILSLDSGELVYARAGHNPPLLVRADGGPVELLEPAGVVLGVVDDPELPEERTILGAGDALVMYTDGVTEAVDETFGEFGTDRLCRLLATASDRSAGDLVSLVDTAVQVFSGSRPQSDDLTLLAIKRIDSTGTAD